MSKERNKYGLSRTIPEPVKRLVRQKWGFGCIFCGIAIIEYEHVDPEFVDCKKHDPDNIVPLCPTCHAMVTTKKWSKQKVKIQMKTPNKMGSGYTKNKFDFCSYNPVLVLGGNSFKNSTFPIKIRGQEIIKIEKPKIKGEPFLLSAVFTDESGKVSLVILKNEWLAYDNCWDLETPGSSIIIRKGLGDIVLKLRYEEPNILHVEKLKMSIFSKSIIISGDNLSIDGFNWQGCTFDDNGTDLDF